MIQSQQNKYLTTAIQTATPAQLLIMLYDGAIRFCRSGIDAIRQGDVEKANTSLCRAQDIISEFVASLDRQSPVAEGLLRLYEYFTHRLVEANLHKTIEPVEEVIAHLQELKETWIQAAREQNKTASAVTHA